MAKPALQAYVEDQFGGSFYVATKEVTVGTTPTLIADNDFERMGLFVSNEGTTAVTLKPQSDVAATVGAQLLGSGSNISLNAFDDGVLVGYSWYAIVASGTQKVYVQETLRYTEQPTNAGQ